MNFLPKIISVRYFKLMSCRLLIVNHGQRKNRLLFDKYYVLRASGVCSCKQTYTHRGRKDICVVLGVCSRQTTTDICVLTRPAVNSVPVVISDPSIRNADGNVVNNETCAHFRGVT